MTTLKNILFTFAMIVGLSLAVSAQRNDQKKPPPKPPPPVINPGEGKKPRENPKPDARPPRNPKGRGNSD